MKYTLVLHREDTQHYDQGGDLVGSPGAFSFRQYEDPDALARDWAAAQNAAFKFDKAIIMLGSDVLDIDMNSPITNPNHRAYGIFARCVAADNRHKTELAEAAERAIAERLAAAAAQAEHDLVQARKSEMARQEYEDFLRWKSARAGRPWYNSSSGY